MSLRWLADENFDGDISRGLLRRQPGLDLLLLRWIGLGGADDPTILEWAAREERVLLTHDVNTMPSFAYERIRAAAPMAGIVVVPLRLSIARALDDILLLEAAGGPDDVRGQVLYLPLR